MVFFGRRIHFFFAAITSVPVWLAAYTYIDKMPVSEAEAVATGATMCFFLGVFAGRYLAEVWRLHTQASPRKLVIGLGLFLTICLSWLFLHADYSTDGVFVNMLLSLLPFIAMSLAAGVLIKVIRAQAAHTLNEARSSAAHSQSELRLLQSQLSPHFLFNTLNNLYGLSLTQHERIPNLLLRLSDLLRHTVYGANELFVPLKDEVDYLENYIEFEKIRLGERLSLKADINATSVEDYMIAPMVLIVFVENAFKHAKNTADSQIYIDISLKTWNNRIFFSVKNSYSRQEKPFDRNSGFGLDNVRKRLTLLYPGAYELDVQANNVLYTITLQLKNRNNHELHPLSDS